MIWYLSKTIYLKGYHMRDRYSVTLPRKGNRQRQMAIFVCHRPLKLALHLHTFPKNGHQVALFFGVKPHRDVVVDHVLPPCLAVEAANGNKTEAHAG